VRLELDQDKLRMEAEDRNYLGRLKNRPIYLPGGRYVPLEQIAIISPGAEDGALENSQTALLGYMLKPVPWMVAAILTILMFQVQRFTLTLLALPTAPLGLIGVAGGMLLFDQPLGFVAQLGILALSGMIIRNSVILIDQIDEHLAEGQSPWEAVIESAVFRFRPIMLTAAAAILAMIPLMRSSFWGPMAVAIAGGLLAATILTLLVLPCMYATAFKVRPRSENGS